MVGQLHLLLLLMNFRQKNLSTEKITMPLHAGKGSTSAAAGFLESNHSLSTNPYLPFFFFFFTLVSLPPPPPPSSSDHQGLTSTGAQSRGKNTAGEKQTDESK